MTDPFDKINRLSGDSTSGDGFSFLDMLDLTPPMQQIMRLLIPEMGMGYTVLCEAVAALPEGERLSQAEIDDTLAQLIQLGHVSKQTIRGEIVLKVNLGRRKARTNTLDKDIWDSLNFDEK